MAVWLLRLNAAEIEHGANAKTAFAVDPRCAQLVPLCRSSRSGDQGWAHHQLDRHLGDVGQSGARSCLASTVCRRNEFGPAVKIPTDRRFQRQPDGSRVAAWRGGQDKSSTFGPLSCFLGTVPAARTLLFSSRCPKANPRGSPMKRTSSAGRLFQFAVLTLVVVAATGCEERTYEIDLKPRGDTLERHLTLKRTDLPNHTPKSLTADDRPELERIARAYHARTPSLPKRDLAFSGAFGSVLPQDIGGDGHYVHYESPFGRIRIYVERFRGNDNLYASLESRRKAVDQVVDLIVGWFESELGRLPEWSKLRSFLDGQFRVDLQNLSLLVWSTNVRDIFESNDSLAEVGLRAAQYLVERNYASYDEAPALRRELQDALQRDNAAALLARISRFLAARAGASEAHWKQALVFLSDPGRTQVSWHRFFWQSPYFKKHVADLAAGKAQSRPLQRPTLRARRPTPRTRNRSSRPNLRKRARRICWATSSGARFRPVPIFFLTSAASGQPSKRRENRSGPTANGTRRNSASSGRR